jgi:tetratricopeptide (TPR) repeat protein
MFLCATFLTKLQGQTFNEANNLFNSGKFFKASIEFERIIFQEKENQNINTARYKKALCYRHLSRYTDAVKELNRINLFSAVDTMKTKILYEKAFNLMLNENFQEALWNIKRINKEKISNSTYNDILPLKVLILNHNRKWDKAENTLKQWIESLSISGNKINQLKDSVSLIYSDSKLPTNYSTEKAENFSRFIPGAGHAYTGHILEGVGNFMLNASVLGFGVYQIWYGYYFTGYIGGLGIFYKTYFGGMERAAYLAKTEKNKEMNKFNQLCTNFIQRQLDNK